MVLVDGDAVFSSFLHQKLLELGVFPLNSSICSSLKERLDLSVAEDVSTSSQVVRLRVGI